MRADSLSAEDSLAADDGRGIPTPALENPGLTPGFLSPDPGLETVDLAVLLADPFESPLLAELK